jgi:hypothetical protein
MAGPDASGCKDTEAAATSARDWKAMGPATAAPIDANAAAAIESLTIVLRSLFCVVTMILALKRLAFRPPKSMRLSALI